MDWDKLKSFQAAAETGSLTAAGLKLGISQSAVSRQIQSLEEDIGVPLFQRHARGLILTDAGQTLHKATSEMAAVARMAAATLQEAGDTPKGELRVTAPVAFGTHWLSPRLGRFASSYPGVRVNLLLDDHEYDLLKLEAEVAVRLWPASQAELIQRRLAGMRTSLYASKSYLTRYGRPAKPADLDTGHFLVGYSGDVTRMEQVNWAQRVGRDDRPPREAHVLVNSVLAMQKAVEAGVGIAALPDYLALENPDLERLLPEMAGPMFEVYFIYPSDLRRSRRIAAFREFLTREISSWNAG
jgi:DNA-binding transcriptional LysR family regulator